MRSIISVAALLSIGVLLGSASFGGRSAEDIPARAASLLSEKCLKCHDSAKKSGGLDLSTRATAASALGDAARSRLVKAVAEGRMPPSGKLPGEEIALLKSWVVGGAVYPRPKLEAETAMSPTLWSFQPIRTPPVPAIHNPKSKIQNPIDAFILQQLNAKALPPSPPADRLTLLRRVTVDLTGLPPTPEE